MRQSQPVPMHEILGNSRKQRNRNLNASTNLLLQLATELVEKKTPASLKPETSEMEKKHSQKQTHKEHYS
jgi:hypothetical protein